MKKANQKWFLLLAATLALFAATGVAADKLRIQAAIWPGELTPEHEQRAFSDDLLNGTGLGRIDLPMSGKDETLAWGPIGIELHKQLGKGSLVVGVNWHHYNPELKYTGLWTTPAVSLVSLQDYEQENAVFDLGYRFALMDGALILTPGVGYRRYSERFNYDELTLGGLNQISLESPWKSNASGLFLALNVRYKLAANLALVADYRTSALMPEMTGSMSHQRTVIGVSGSTITGSYDDATADVRAEMLQYALGLEFSITDSWKVYGGVRVDELQISYPGYFNIPLTITSSSTSLAANFVNEFITDYFFYSQKMKTEKKLLYFGVAYELGL